MLYGLNLYTLYKTNVYFDLHLTQTWIPRQLQSQLSDILRF